MSTFKVTWVRDNLKDLEEELNALVAGGDDVRVVSVSWQPDRPNPDGGNPIPAGYTCVSEHPDA
jgi:hypothetical protein